MITQLYGYGKKYSGKKLKMGEFDVMNYTFFFFFSLNSWSSNCIRWKEGTFRNPQSNIPY